MSLQKEWDERQFRQEAARKREGGPAFYGRHTPFVPNPGLPMYAVHVETTGWDPARGAELLGICLCDVRHPEAPVYSAVFKPERAHAWPSGEAVSGISPADVKDAPSLRDSLETLNAMLGEAGGYVFWDRQFCLRFFDAQGVRINEGAMQFDLARDWALRAVNAPTPGSRMRFDSLENFLAGTKLERPERNMPAKTAFLCRAYDVEARRGMLWNRGGDPEAPAPCGRVLSLQDLLGRNVFALRIETTGLDPRKGDEILEACVMDAADGRILFDSKFRPEGKAEWPEAERFNGISPADVAHAPRFRDCIRDLEEILSHADAIVCWNASFDGKFLLQQGLKLPERAFCIDVMKDWSEMRAWNERRNLLRNRAAYRPASDLMQRLKMRQPAPGLPGKTQFVCEVLGRLENAGVLRMRSPSAVVPPWEYDAERAEAARKAALAPPASVQEPSSGEVLLFLPEAFGASGRCIRTDEAGAERMAEQGAERIDPGAAVWIWAPSERPADAPEDFAALAACAPASGDRRKMLVAVADLKGWLDRGAELVRPGDDSRKAAWARAMADMEAEEAASARRAGAVSSAEEDASPEEGAAARGRKKSGRDSGDRLKKKLRGVLPEDVAAAVRMVGPEESPPEKTDEWLQEHAGDVLKAKGMREDREFDALRQAVQAAFAELAEEGDSAEERFAMLAAESCPLPGGASLTLDREMQEDGTVVCRLFVDDPEHMLYHPGEEPEYKVVYKPAEGAEPFGVDDVLPAFTRKLANGGEALPEGMRGVCTGILAGMIAAKMASEELEDMEAERRPHERPAPRPKPKPKPKPKPEPRPEEKPKVRIVQRPMPKLKPRPRPRPKPEPEPEPAPGMIPSFFPKPGR